ncbi:MGMT family protein [Peribacillus sp. SCS-37]|uniref:MGMT family protein n=1 Tax=Paraperibacillus esterisolvens TaxID=3115296 RepID=UPI003905D1ED
MNPFTRKALKILSSIPEGRVMTYGQAAALSGSPRGARQIVRILHSMSDKHNLPWHRVINARGMIAIQDRETAILQRELLLSEGIPVSSEGFIDLAVYRADVHPVEEMGEEHGY